MSRTRLIAIATLLAGCAAKPPTTTVPTSADGMPTAKVITLAQPDQPPPAAPDVAELGPARDATPAQPTLFQIGVYQLELPQGKISSNEAFWKPFDETFLGLWQHSLLHKNGLRVGRASRVELNYLREELEGAEETPQNLIGTESKDFTMDVRKGVPAQTIFYFDKDGALVGKNFEPCDNAFAINFRRARRSEDRVRIAIAPVVRNQRSRLEATVSGDSFKVREVTDQTIYGLGIEAVLGVDECLVIAPDPSAIDNETSVGRIFMMEDRPAQRVEKVLVIWPRKRATLIEATMAGRK